MYRNTIQGDGELQEAEGSPRDLLRKSNYTEHHRSAGQPHRPDRGPDEGGLLQLSGHLDEWALHMLWGRWEETSPRLITHGVTE